MLVGYLITGCSGFIGFTLTQKLLNEGHLVVGIDSLEQETDPKLKEYRTKKLLECKNFKFINKSINDSDLQSHLPSERIDYVIHLASKDFYYQHNSAFSYSPFVDTNVLGTTKIMELAKSLKAKKFIFSSTHSVYGNTKKDVLTERKLLPKPTSPHGASKLAAEEVVKFLAKFYKIPSIILRVFSVYGPGMPERTAILQFIKQLDTTGKVRLYGDFLHHTRDFIYVDDVVECIRSVVNKRLQLQTINIATGKSLDLKEVLNNISYKMGVDLHEKLISNEGREFVKASVSEHSIANIDKLRKVLKKAPSTTFDQGIVRTIDWYKKNKELYS